MEGVKITKLEKNRVKNRKKIESGKRIITKIVHTTHYSRISLEVEKAKLNITK